MNKVIALKDLTPLAKGGSRFVFRHPDNPDHLIKVIRPEVIEGRFGTGTKWYKRLRRFGKYLSYQREIQEFLAVLATTDEAPNFLQIIVGFAQTDLGLGLVIEGVFQAEGELAPTLGDLLKNHRYNKKVEAALEECFTKILACPVVLSDYNVGNFVYLEIENRFIMIDGQGNANSLSLKGLSARANRKAKLKRFDRFRTRIGRYKKQYNYPD
ncbi:MAG: hypothetical protein ACI9NQ_001144 [Paracoccaceae bacterium]|jgi:hypothetical protein